MKKTTAEFIEQSNQIHANEFDYSLTKYINNRTKVKIICKIHGEFEQLPMNHLKGTKCKKCIISNRSNTTDSFIVKANIKHNNRYDYSLTEYINNHTNVNIICPIHGIFEQRPINHINGTGCPSCGLDSRRETNIVRYGVEYPTQSSDIIKTRTINNLEKYGVKSPSSLIHVRNKVKNTVLEKYGVNNPFHHELIKNKIKDTKREKYGTMYHSQQHMINILPLIEDPDWLFDQYINQNKTSNIIATELGIGATTILRYLHAHEINIKYSYGYSCRCIQWLDSIMESENIHIQHALNGGEYQIPGTRYKADGYCAETNTIYEFHGDIFHGNPTVFNPTEYCHPWSDLTAGELYQKTVEREQDLRKLGYNLIVMWENDWNNIVRDLYNFTKYQK